MSEEERKAIGQCKLLLAGDITLHILDDDGGTAYTGIVNKEYNKDLETVLNLIEKLENMYKKEYNEHMEMKRQNEVLRNNERILKEKIEELENRLKEKENIVKKSSLEAQKYFDMLMEVEYGRDTIPKQKIRDKIEELKKQTSTINDKQISKKYSHIQFARECCIGLLKELLGE